MGKKDNFDPTNETSAALITLLSQHHAIYGEIFTKEYGVTEYGFDAKFLDMAYASKLLVSALQERGIEVDHYDFDTPKPNDEATPAYRSKALTPMQLVVANTMLDLIDTRSQKKKLQDLNVTTATYNSWLRDPVFSGYLRDRAESLLGDNLHEAHLALLDKVRSGDTRALSLYYEITGRHVSQSGISPQQQSFNAEFLVTAIIDIVNDEVDSATALRITERLKNLATARTIAGELVNNEPIAVPQVAPMRQLTSAVGTDDD